MRKLALSVDTLDRKVADALQKVHQTHLDEKKQPGQTSTSISTLAAMLPVIKFAFPNYYMIGTSIRTVEFYGTGEAQVRSGGGFNTLNEFVRKEAITQFVRLIKRMKSEKETFEQAVVFFYDQWAKNHPEIKKNIISREQFILNIKEGLRQKNNEDIPLEEVKEHTVKEVNPMSTDQLALLIKKAVAA